LRRPSLALALAVNRVVRLRDEWFDEPDDVQRVQNALASIADFDDPVAAAAALAYRLTRAQAFGEGNKRTALLLARWVLDRNGVDGSRLLRPDDREFADLLVKAASGRDVEDELIALLNSRR
jgi:prophage maintenance system killer protein